MKFGLYYEDEGQRFYVSKLPSGRGRNLMQAQEDPRDAKAFYTPEALEEASQRIMESYASIRLTPCSLPDGEPLYMGDD